MTITPPLPVKGHRTSAWQRALQAQLLCALALPFVGVALAATASPFGANQSVKVLVPPEAATAPFDVARTLIIPKGFSIRVVARVADARFMALAPNGDLLVSSPGRGIITLLRPDGQDNVRHSVFASGMHHPHDIVFHALGSEQYVYIAESNRVIRAPYSNGQTKIGPIQTVVGNLPDASSPGLKGSYGHQLKNMALRDDKLYVSIASTCNACLSDTRADLRRGAIYEYDANGKNGRLYASGLRNAEGIRFKPGTNELWAVVNSRDNIAYPYHKDWNGDGKDDYGKVMQSYVDGHPPDLLVKVRDGGNYGWPFCNPNPDDGRDNMPYDRDVQMNSEGDKLDCNKIDRVTKGIDPHSAPLGMNFLYESGLPAPYRNALVTALHGCWNCSAPNGHKIVLFPFREDGSVGDPVDLVTGWISDEKTGRRWGRPVTAIPNGKGGMYISDDYSGTVYLLQYDEARMR